MGYDYRGFQDSVAGELNRASMAAQGMQVGNQRKVRIKDSDLARIPPGASVELETVPFHRLRCGDVVMVRNGSEVQLRRFLKLGMTGSRTFLVTTHDKANEGVETLKTGALVGRIVSAEYRGHTYNPGEEGALQALLNRLTDYGTTNPFRKMARGVATLAKVLRLA